MVQRLGAPAFGLLICCMDMVPFVPCGPAAFTSGALYGSYVGACRRRLQLLSLLCRRFPLGLSVER